MAICSDAKAVSIPITDSRAYQQSHPMNARTPLVVLLLQTFRSGTQTHGDVGNDRGKADKPVQLKGRLQLS